jgi:hypothetical protein
MKNIVWTTLFIALFSSNVMAEECSSQDRVEQYDSIIKSLTKMEKELPELSPKEVDYYADVKKKYPQNPTKYSRIIGSDEYVIWDNAVHIDHLIGLAASAKGYIVLDDPFNELIMITNLLMRAISDHSGYLTSYRDSELLVDRKLVTTKYSDEAKMIAFKIAVLGLCVEKPLTRLESK